MRDRYAVIGNPVAHSKSPQIHAAFARATGQALDYTRIEAPLDGFAAALASFRAAGGRGANVTVPFKEEAFGLCETTSERSRLAGAVNTLKLDGAEIVGDTTDGVGLVRDLVGNLEMDLAGARVLLVGAGGAARGVLGSLLDAGVQELVIANRTAGKAVALAARFPGVACSALEELTGRSFDIVINATSAGLAGAAPTLPAGILTKGTLAYDMVYGRDTPFLAAARAAGARASDGLGMLVEQAAESFHLWRGVRPQTGPVLAELRSA
jgi:shikimate dehydrogenase